MLLSRSTKQGRSKLAVMGTLAVPVVALLVTCAARIDHASVNKTQARDSVFDQASAGLGTLFTPPPAAEACPKGMVLVSGSYCPEVEHRCLEWMDPPGQYHHFRCAKYAQPAVCKASRKVMRYCVDVDEQRIGVDPRPANHVSYVVARETCAARGAHVCTESEWTFACEGEEMRPYPYGFVRDASACNIDRTDLGFPNGGLHDHRSAVGANPKCVSPFGVRDLAGNLEEWATRENGKWSKSTILKGSWWLPGKSTCRAANAGHDEVYQGTETGFRCCL